jgi:hypothetical protein
MRTRWKLAALTAAACTFALGAFVATTVGSGGSGYSPAAAVFPDHASPAGKLVAKRGGPKIRHFLARNAREVDVDDFDLAAAKCPEEFPNPISGGAFTSGPGLAIINLSRRNPGGVTRSRTEYIAVQNVSDVVLEWKPEAVCGKRIGD